MSFTVNMQRCFQIEKITLLLAYDNISRIKIISAASVSCSTALYFQGHPLRTPVTYYNCLVINNVLLDMVLNRVNFNWAELVLPPTSSDTHRWSVVIL